MLKNYITTAINNLLKNKLYSAINIIGLAIGLAVCLLITLYVQNELSYDKHWEKADLIYRVNDVNYSLPDTGQLNAETSILTLPALKKYFSNDIEAGTRIFSLFKGDIGYRDIRLPGKIYSVDKEFINMFQVEVLKGSLKNILLGPGNIALSEESANQYFGDRDPIGETIIFYSGDDKEQYKVSAVYRFISPNTVLNVPNFSLFDDSKLPESYRAWSFPIVETYIRFSETSDIDKFTDRLPNFINQNIPGEPPPGQKMSDISGYSLQKMSDIYFNPINSQSNPQRKIGNKAIIAVFTIISIVVLIIGCINFIILTTAKATQRAHEVAMRKVVGARFKQLVIQFLGESMLVTLLAILFAVGITELALPFFEALVDKELTVPYYSLKSYIFVFILLLSVGLLGGLYPSLVLSRFSPNRALKANQTTEANGSFKLRNVLVIFQFTASIGLIIATAVAFFQLQYASKHDPGFNPDNVLVLHNINNPEASGHKNTLQEELLKLPGITNAALSSMQPTGLGSYSDVGFRPKNSSAQQDQEFFSYKIMRVGYNFFKTYQIPLLSGRYFSREMDKEEPVSNFSYSPDVNYEQLKDRRIIINLAAAKQLGYTSADEAVGEIVVQGKQGKPGYEEYLIIGVVEDSQYNNLRLKPVPEGYRLMPDRTFFLTVRYKGDYQKVVKEAERVWHEVVGDIPLQYSTVRQNMATVYTREVTENMLLIAFALLAVFIACMGLFGMASFTVDRRVKEIGVRKVMGAKVKDIVRLLGWNFLKPVLIANIIAWPVAIFAMQNWLERFPYRFNPLFMIPICLGSGLIALVIAWFTVAGNTTRVAKSKPIKALRYE